MPLERFQQSTYYFTSPQELENRLVPVLGSPKQWRPTMFIFRVDIGLARAKQPQLDSLTPSKFDSLQQRRAARFISRAFCAFRAAATRGTPSIGSIVWRGPATSPSHPLGVFVWSMAAAGWCARPDSLRYVGGDRRGTAAVVVEEGLVALDFVLVLFVLEWFDGRRAGGTIITLHRTMGNDPDNNHYHAHAGVLASAKSFLPTLIPTLTTALTTFLSTLPPATPVHLNFTGHSAGGTVAAMLYAHMLRPHPTMHCLIFGAPPLTTITLHPTLVPLWSLDLAIVNEGDPIPRVNPA
ncbi:hypothetical protein QBC42DRAFT_295385 [Cladorrhinum samala]|uniref:sn-1-specific diacylglycerol lipase n=1 Tax=Cladorrhinum samala TaxID=585594 RepID=A0AAV9HY91_9PEZI|nr:hypothetical protein QBC42DRAFT_295385 [Cladorrhinum samala]